MTLLLLLLSVAWVDTALERTGLSANAADYVITDFETQDVIAEHWSEPVTASPGSLLKPFVVLAYGRKYGKVFPELECTGETCWLPAGHGRVDVTRALSHSCNTYFRELSLGISTDEVGYESSQLGLRAPPPDSRPSALWGLLADWVSTPYEILGAYAELAQRRSEPTAAIVLNGLRQAARDGTAATLTAQLGEDTFAKTGTATCVHPRGGDADGFAVAVYPADSPRYSIVVRLHNRTGRTAASAAAAILRALTSR